MVQAPISRTRPLSDMRAVGKTTMKRVAQHGVSGHTGADSLARHGYFRHHALAPTSMYTSVGGLGDVDHGYVVKPSMRGSGMGRDALREASFGTPSVSGSEIMRHKPGKVHMGGRRGYMGPIGRTAV